MWSLSEEQVMLQDTARRLFESEYSFEQRRASLADAGYSRELWERLAELGLLGVPFDESMGGFGGDAVDVALLMQELGRALVVCPYLPTVVLGGELVRHAAPEVREELLPRLVGGDLQLAFAFAEPQSRFDLEDVATRAVRAGDGFSLSGAKSVVHNAPDADHLIVSARLDGAQRDPSGLGLFLVPRAQTGVSIAPYRTNDDHWAGDVTLSDVVVPAHARIADDDSTLDVIEVAVDLATVAACAEGIGAMDAVMSMTQDYLNTREQFGKPIGKNQALQFRMVDMFYALEESRSMLAWAAQSLPGDPSRRRAAVSATKVKLGETARFVGQQGIQLHGAIGMTEDYPVGHYYKRLETVRLLFGDPDHHLTRYGRYRQSTNDPQ